MANLILLVGPSGSGKSTLANHLAKQVYKKVLTTTTRIPRAREKDENYYYFTSKEDFLNQRLIEHTKYAGNFYGLTQEEVENKLIHKGQDCFVIMDKQGVKAMRRHNQGKDYNLVVVGVKAPKKDLVKRLQERKKANSSRLNLLKEELKVAEELADYTLINKQGCLEYSKEQLNSVLREEAN